MLMANAPMAVGSRLAKLPVKVVEVMRSGPVVEGLKPMPGPNMMYLQGQQAVSAHEG